MNSMQAYTNNFPNLCGCEDQVAKAMRDARDQEVFRPESPIDFGRIKSATAIALHMHQPLIPAGGFDLRSADIISNLKFMMDDPGSPDHHNATVFHDCYRRMGRFIPELAAEGKEPRVMLEYSGTLLHGLHHMGLLDVFDHLRLISTDPRYRRMVEWLGCPWGHAVAPSTPVQDFALHVRAWQHFFAALFGLEALKRVRGFSPSEMALPNHPDVAYAFVKTLREAGFRWVLVQEHTVERPDNGWGPERKHLPHRLVCRNSDNEVTSIIALIKTQGSDTKLVAQMQPYYEARGLDRWPLAGKQVPPLVTQVADGENGGVMMNEFPGKYMEVVRESSGSDTCLINGTEYLEHLFAMGVKEEDLPEVQPIHQKKLWDRYQPGQDKAKLTKAIEELKKEDHRFNMEGGSWTNNISWVKGYENLLGPMEQVSALFHEKLTAQKVPSNDPRYQQALFLLLCSQTSCYRYWGQGRWTDYGIELCRRLEELLGKR